MLLRKFIAVIALGMPVADIRESKTPGVEFQINLMEA